MRREDIGPAADPLYSWRRTRRETLVRGISEEFTMKLHGCRLRFVALIGMAAGMGGCGDRAEDPATDIKRLGGTVQQRDGRVVEVDLAKSKATDIDLVALTTTTFADLKTLKLTDCPITDAALPLLTAFQKLQMLRLSGTKISDAGLAQLFSGVMSRLQSGTKISDAGLARLAPLQALRELDLSKTQIGDSGLAQLGHLSGLSKLNLYTTRVTDAGLDHLQALKSLTWLNLDNTPVSDAGLAKLEPLVQLEFLHLGRTQITDAGLKSVMKLTKLTKIHVTHTKVTAEGVKRLQQALPQCTVLWKTE
jgi:hypothetical protein